jgi:hypothetical protein
MAVCFLQGNYPEESTQHSEHGKSLKSRIINGCFLLQSPHPPRVLSRKCFKNLVYKIRKWSKVCIEDICGSEGVAAHFLELDNVCLLDWSTSPCGNYSGLAETQSRSRQFGEGQRKVSFLYRQLNTYLSRIQLTGRPLFWLTLRAVVWS